ncbi:MAG: glycosyltransferase [Candidatus Pacearchaeota archaeon]
MKVNKKILILHENIGFGHTKVAEVVGEYVKEKYKGCDLLVTNVIGKYNPFIKYFITKIYFFMINYLPYLWEFLHEKKEISSFNRFFINLFIFLMKPSYRKIISDFKPDFVISTYAFSVGVASKLKDEGFRFKLIGLVTDFNVHGYWIYDNVDYYCIPFSNSINKELKSKISGKIVVTGIPVSNVFYRKKDKNFLRNKLGFKQDVPLILIVGGGEGIGKISEINYTIDNLKYDLQKAIITGTNIRLFNKLLKTKNKKFTKIYGFVNNIDEFIEASDIVVSKAGGSFLSECVAKRIPPIIYGNLPAQERNNAEFFSKKFMGFYTKNLDELILLIGKLMNNKNLINRYSLNMKKFSMDNASKKILNIILKCK